MYFTPQLPLRSSQINPNSMDPSTDPEHLPHATRASFYSGTYFRTATETAPPTATAKKSNLDARKTPGNPVTEIQYPPRI